MGGWQRNADVFEYFKLILALYYHGKSTRGHCQINIYNAIRYTGNYFIVAITIQQTQSITLIIF